MEALKVLGGVSRPLPILKTIIDEASLPKSPLAKLIDKNPIRAKAGVQRARKCLESAGLLLPRPRVVQFSELGRLWPRISSEDAYFISELVRESGNGAAQKLYKTIGFSLSDSPSGRLSNASIQLLRASQRSLTLALIEIGIPKRKLATECSSQFAASIGLIGCAVEQAMSACLIAEYGPRATMKRGGNRYKTLAEIIHDFRAMLTESFRSNFRVFCAIPNFDEFCYKLDQMALHFSLLSDSRAAGLHAGVGVTREVLIIKASEVSEFLTLLAQAPDLGEVLLDIPQIPDPIHLKSVLVEDLARNFQQAMTASDQGYIIRSLYLLAPEISDDLVDLAALKRVALLPARADISLLVTTLEMATPIKLVKKSDEGAAFPVVFQPGNPSAMPVAPGFTSRALGDIRSQYWTELGLANGNLDNNLTRLPLPHLAAKLFGLDPDEFRESLGYGDKAPTAHETWSFIASSLLRSNAAGPYWFLVRRTQDLGQLVRLLERLDKIKNSEGASRAIRAFLIDLELIRKGKAKSDTTLEQHQNAAQRHRDSLYAKLGKYSPTDDRYLTQEATELLAQVSRGEMPIGGGAQAIVNSIAEVKGRLYWIRQLADSSAELADAKTMVTFLNSDDMKGAHPNCWKAIRLIDMLHFGPARKI